MKHPKALILCYHRIAEGVEDPYSICVRPDNFSAHLDEIRRRWEPSTLDEISAPSRLPRVVVTFDDGYSDNLLNALPIAEEKGVPITIFITSGIVGSASGFWWDRLASLLRSRPPAQRTIDLTIGGRTVQIELGSSHPGADLQAVRRQLLPLSVAEINGVLDSAFQRWSVELLPVSDARPLTQDELRQVSGAELVTIGAHTVDHVRLASRPEQEQIDTIVNSKVGLEQALGQTVSHFAYPFGSGEDFDHRAVEAVRLAGFATACTTLPGRVSPSTDRHRLPRRLVMDWGRLRFGTQMRRWQAW